MRTVLLPLLAGFLITGALAVGKDAIFREPGAAYLADVLQKPLKLKVLHEAKIWFDAPMERSLGALAPGQMVEVQALLDDKVRVLGKARQGQVSGWVLAADLEALQPDFVAKVKQSAIRKTQVDDLISKNEVAVGMTPDEVLQSLGKPPKKSTRQDAAGTQELWEYVRYERIPQETTSYDTTGRLINTVIYVKVPVGSLAVSFNDGLVATIEQSEGNLLKNARITTVAAPLVVE